MIKIQPSLFINFAFLKISLYYQMPRRCSKQGNSLLKLRMWSSYISQSTRRTISIFRNCILINMVPRFYIWGERIWFFKLFRALHHASIFFLHNAVELIIQWHCCLVSLHTPPPCFHLLTLNINSMGALEDSNFCWNKPIVNDFWSGE